MNKAEKENKMAKYEKKAYSQKERKALKDELFKIGNESVSKNIFYSIKSHYKILYIVSSEEDRIVSFFQKFCISEGYTGYAWDCSRGLIDIHSGKEVTTSKEDIKDPEGILSYVVDETKQYDENDDKTKGRIFLLLDFHKFLEDADAIIERKLKEFAFESEIDTVVIVAPEFVCGNTIDKEVTMINFPYPSHEELNTILSEMRDGLMPKKPKIAKAADKRREELIHAISGMTLRESKNALAKTIVQNNEFKTSTLIREKELTIRKSGLLEICDVNDVTIDDVGGLETIKYWLEVRKSAFCDDARDFGLPSPKGILLAGCPGSGKSLTCKSVASLYDFPLLRLDMGMMFSSRVGASESNMREAIKIAEGIHPVCLWLDEVEKGLSGVASSAQTDGGTTARVVSTLLTWMQEKQTTVFVVATANDIASIPPEFMRAGRFDEIFFLDLPDLNERADIVRKLLRRKKRNPDDFDLFEIARACDTYVGAEIEKAIDNSLFICYHENKRKLKTSDVVESFSQFVPLYKSRKDEIDAMRSWAKDGGAIIANSSVKSKMMLPKKKKSDITKLDFDEELEI